MSFNTAFTHIACPIQWSNQIISETIPLQFAHPVIPPGSVIPVIPFGSTLPTQYFGSQALPQACPVTIPHLTQAPTRPITVRRLGYVSVSKGLGSSNTGTHRDEISDTPEKAPSDLSASNQVEQPITTQVPPSIDLLGIQVEGPTSFVNFDSNSSENDDVDRILFGEYISSVSLIVALNMKWIWMLLIIIFCEDKSSWASVVC